MKFSTSRVDLRFVAVFAVLFAFQNIHCLEGLRTEGENNSIDGNGIAEKRFIPLRQRKSEKTYATPNITEILERLKAMEKKYVCGSFNQYQLICALKLIIINKEQNQLV